MEINEKIKLKYMGKKYQFRVAGITEKITEDFYYIITTSLFFNPPMTNEEHISAIRTVDKRFLTATRLVKSAAKGEYVFQHRGRFYLEKLAPRDRK